MDSHRCSSLYEKIPPTPATNQIAGFVEFHPLTSQKKDKTGYFELTVPRYFPYEFKHHF